jgi:kynurenine formamidase
MAERTIPSKDEVLGYLRDRRNWGRWGEDDQRGAINLITAEKRVAAARLVQSGRAVSLSRPFPKTPGPGNPNPAQHFMRWFDRGNGGAALDYYGISYHGFVTTHIDALCHVWDDGGLWGGRDPKEVLTTQGARWGDITQWGDGITTRGVLLDVPKYRGEPHVTIEKPVHGWELEEVARAQGITVEPGDALLVYSGRESWQSAHPNWGGGDPQTPGLHASCLPFIRDHDVAVLGWDLMDAGPNEYGVPWTVHGALFAYGVGLLDNSLLEPLANACAEEGRYEFMLTIAPLRVAGGTGSPVNPIALF